MSDRRIDPKTIKTTETEPRARGGQGTISVGAIVLPEQIPDWDPEKLLAIKKLDWNLKDAESSAKFFKVSLSSCIAF